MLTTRSPWEVAHHASSSPTTPILADRHDMDPEIASGRPSSGRSLDADPSGQDAVEGRDPAKPASRRRAIGIMFGIDPKNLYEAPGETPPADRTERDRD